MKRSSYFSQWFSMFNIFWSYDSQRSREINFFTPNIDIIKQNINKELFDPKLMKEAHATSKSLEEHPNKSLYTSCVLYYNGDCWYNSRLSYSNNLSGLDIQRIDDIKESIQVVNPLPFSVNLFHGFESHLLYNSDKWEVGNTYHFPFFLSKTMSWKVATFFAATYDSKYYQSYLLCRYDEPGSKHVCLDIKTADSDEYEFLSGFETFKLVEKIYHLSLLPYPVIRVYYVMDYVK